MSLGTMPNQIIINTRTKPTQIRMEPEDTPIYRQARKEIGVVTDYTEAETRTHTNNYRLQTPSDALLLCDLRREDK